MISDFTNVHTAEMEKGAGICYMCFFFSKETSTTKTSVDTSVFVNQGLNHIQPHSALHIHIQPQSTLHKHTKPHLAAQSASATLRHTRPYPSALIHIQQLSHYQPHSAVVYHGQIVPCRLHGHRLPLKNVIYAKMAPVYLCKLKV